MNTPAIPTWEWNDLETLSGSGDLYGLNPVIIGSIDQAESSGQGGGINASGYGGFFGLSDNATYPGGSTSPALLHGTDEQSFESQAEIAASAFNSYLQQAGGDPVAAEEIYQSGSASGPTEGSRILAANLGMASAGAAVTSAAVTTGLNPNPFDLFGIPQAAASGLWGAVQGFLVKAILVIAGLGIIVLGVYHLAAPNLRQELEKAAPLAEAAA